MAEALNVIMRWLHIASVAALIGGILYGRLVMVSAITGLAPDARDAMGDHAAVRFRPLVYFSIAALVVSGIYNILSNPGHSPLYHMLLGVKLLLALHVFAVSILIVQPKNPRRTRLMTGALISGLAVIFLAAWLRRIF